MQNLTPKIDAARLLNIQKKAVSIYTLTFYNLLAYLQARRINSALGMYHEARTGHPALASELMEELRAPLQVFDQDGESAHIF